MKQALTTKLLRKMRERPNKVSWENVCRHFTFTEEQLEEFASNLKWNHILSNLSEQQREQAILKYYELFHKYDWRDISKYYMTFPIVEKLSQFLDWGQILEYYIVSEEILLKNLSIIFEQSQLTFSTIKKNRFKLSPRVYQAWEMLELLQ